MTHDYKKPLQELKRETSPHRTTSFEALGIIVSENMPAIMHALELAIALQPKLISEAPEGKAAVICVFKYDISALPKPEVAE